MKHKTTEKIPVYMVTTRFGKPWEERTVLMRKSVMPTSYRVSDAWHRKIINVEIYRSGIITYYA
jgi:hypothetical protein